MAKILGILIVVAMLTLTLVAVITQATATQQAAQAATVASVGQTAGTLTVLVLVGLLLLLLLVGVGAILYLVARLRQAEAMVNAVTGGRAAPPRRRWVSGPNARWQQQGMGQNPIDALVQIETLRMLREMRQPAPAPRWAAPPALEYDDDDLPTWGWDA